MKDLSIITTMYQSAPYLQEFYDRVTAAAKQITENYEIIFVNDGSPDNSLAVAIGLHQQDPKVKVINFSRNFGHHKAIMTGLASASGHKVFLIDCDLEEDPELLLEFNEEFEADADLDILMGQQAKRRGGWFEKISGHLWYKIFNSLTNVKIPENSLTVRMMSQTFCKNLTDFQERELNFATLVELNGFKKVFKIVDKKDKKSTTYDMFRKLNIVVNSITSSSGFPLWLIFYFGLCVTLMSALVIASMFYQRFILLRSVEGWASIITSIFFFGGLTILFLGLIGIYLSKVLEEVKHRPYTIIKSRYGFE